MTKVKKRKNFTQTHISILFVGLAVLAFIFGNSVAGGGYESGWQKKIQPIPLEPENTFGPDLTSIPTPTTPPVLNYRLEPNAGKSNNSFTQDKLDEIERINKQIEGLLFVNQENIKMGKVILEGFYQCENIRPYKSIKDMDFEISCKESALKRIDSNKQEIDRVNTEIQNLELQRSILQSSL